MNSETFDGMLKRAAAQSARAETDEFYSRKSKKIGALGRNIAIAASFAVLIVSLAFLGLHSVGRDIMPGSEVPPPVAEASGQPDAAESVPPSPDDVRDLQVFTVNFEQKFYGQYTADICGVSVVFDGAVESFSPDDIDRLVLVCDGKEIPISATGDVFSKAFTASDGTLRTAFSVAFEQAVTEPGLYSLEITIDGQIYSNEQYILSGDETLLPPDPEMLFEAHLGAKLIEGQPIVINQILLLFDGLWGDELSVDGLTDLVLTRDGEEVPVVLKGEQTRLIFGYTDYRVSIEQITEPGTYVISGKYCGVEFTSLPAILR